MPTWNESTRESNLRDHGLDFVGCETIFDGPVVVLEDDRERYGEQRLNVIGWLGSVVVHMTYTERKNDFYVISLREAEKHEIKRFIKEITR